MVPSEPARTLPPGKGFALGQAGGSSATPSGSAGSDSKTCSGALPAPEERADPTSVGGACIHLPPSAPFRVNAAGDALQSQSDVPPCRNTAVGEEHGSSRGSLVKAGSGGGLGRKQHTQMMLNTKTLIGKHICDGTVGETGAGLRPRRLQYSSPSSASASTESTPTSS